MTTVDSSTNIWVWGLHPHFSHLRAAQIEECQTVCGPDVPSSLFEYHPHLRHTIHVSLSAFKESPSPGSFSVSVICGSDGKMVHLRVCSLDTISKLRAQLCMERPEWKDLNLAFNGKPVMDHQCLRDLGVKEGTMFVTYRRCPGG